MARPAANQAQWDYWVKQRLGVNSVKELVGRDLTLEELNQISDDYNRQEKDQAAGAIRSIQAIKQADDKKMASVIQDFTTVTGRAPTAEEVAKYKAGAGTLDPIKVKEQLQADLSRQKEAEQKAAVEAEKAQVAKDVAAAKAEQDRLNAEAAKKAETENKINQYAASIGGVSPSELAQLRATIEAQGQITTPEAAPATPEQTLQTILGQRKAGITDQTSAFTQLRESLGQQAAANVGQLEATGKAALAEYGTTSEKVKNQVMERLLPQIQSQLAARGLETGGGAFGAQTAKMATDLATQQQQDLAEKQLALSGQTSGLTYQNQADLSNLQAQQSEIQRQQEQADKLAREGRLDQQTLQTLQQRINDFNRQYTTAAGNQSSNMAYQQNLGLQTQQQSFSGLQNMYNRQQQQLQSDLQNRQYEQTLALQQQQLAAQQNRPKQSLGATLGAMAPTLIGAGLGAWAGGSQGAQTGASIGSSLGNTYSSNNNLNLRSPYASGGY
jgi:hypothetical protein